MTNTFNINTATPEEVFEFAQSKLKKLHDIKYPAYADADLCDSEKAESFTDESITELAGLTFKACSSETGGEGQGEHCEVVFQLGNRYFRFYGNYYSYDGTNWDFDTIEEVEAKEETVINYYSKK